MTGKYQAQFRESPLDSGLLTGLFPTFDGRYQGIIRLSSPNLGWSFLIDLLEKKELPGLLYGDRGNFR